MKIKLLKNLILPFALLFGSFIYAQTITGTVSDSSGPLPGVNIIVQGTTTGTQSDFDGNYSLDIPSSEAVLEFSFLGYATQAVPVNGQTTINVTLAEDASQLDEVVVIGYGTTTVKDATGSVASVTSDDFNGGIITSPEQLIQGKTAGVQISQSTGQPGGGMSVRIRGTNSVRSDNNPLFVVDGVPLNGGASSEAAGLGMGTNQAKNPLNFLNPNDIESISILKDASSTAIYGSRGANGVVIITTKTGKGATGGKFEFSSSLSIASPAEEYDLLGTQQFLNAITQYGGNAASQDAGSSTDWQDVVTRTSVSHNQNLTYSHSYTNGSVRATFGYADSQGIIEKSEQERITGRVNATHRFLDDKLKFNLNATLSRVNDKSPPLSASVGHRGDILGSAYSANPTWPNDPDFNAGNQVNPANLLENYGSFSHSNRTLLNLSTEYDLTPELTAKVTLGYDGTDSEHSTMANKNAVNAGDGIQDNGRGVLQDREATSKLLEATLNYTKEFENSKLEALVGYSFQDFQNKGRYGIGWGFGDNTNFEEMSNMLDNSLSTVANSIDGSYQQFGYNSDGELFVNRLFPDVVANEALTAPDGVLVQAVAADLWDTTDELQSYFGRLNYTLYDKYLFTATIRADGSSSFGSENQYGYFPSAAFAWKMNEEDFIGESVSTLKVRLGWGITGNQEGLGYGNYLRRERFGGISIGNGGEVNAPGIGPVAFANPDLKWEETTSYGVGLDFGFNNDRLNGSFDVYRKETAGLLLNVSAAQPSPQPTFFQNLDAIVLNEGVEFAINYDIVQTGDWNWNAAFNVAYNKNELQDFAGLIEAGTIRGQGLSGAFAQILAGGHPLFSYYLREFEGFDENGQPIGDDQTFVGKSALPDVNGGLSTSVTYKNWDFNAYFSGQFGHYVYNNTANAYFTAGSIGNGRNVTTNVLSTDEAPNAAADVSTRFLESGDFVRLQSASIGFNVPLKEESAFDSMRLYLNGQNLLLFTNYSGLDPEVSSAPGGDDLLNGLPTAGIDYAAYPKPRTFTLGLNASF